MKMLNNIIWGFLMVIFLSCNLANTEDYNLKNENYFTDVIHVQHLGDKARIEIEKRGDTIIKHYIDLKGQANENFNNSFNAVCTYQEKLNDLTIISDFYLTENGYRFYFDTQKVIMYCDSLISGLNSNNETLNLQFYQNLKKYVLKQAIPSSDSVVSMLSYDQVLFLNFNSKIVDSQTGDKPKSLLIEFYTTEFSGGKYFYIIKNQGDTLELFHRLDFIN